MGGKGEGGGEEGVGWGGSFEARGRGGDQGLSLRYLGALAFVRLWVREVAVLFCEALCARDVLE